MENKIEVKGYSNINNNIVLHAQGIQAFMHLTQLLWQDKTCMQLARVAYDIQKKTVTVKTRDITYEFINVPLQWDGNIDTHTIYANHIQDLKESEVI